MPQGSAAWRISNIAVISVGTDEIVAFLKGDSRFTWGKYSLT